MADNIGNVITDPKIRRVIYTTYTVVAFIAGIITVGLAANGVLPQWDITLNTVLAAIGAGVSGLAIANTGAAGSQRTADPNAPTVTELDD